MGEEKIGHVIHYWKQIQVAGIHITAGELEVGDTIRIKGHTSDFTQKVASIQIEGESVERARAGDDIGMKVAEYVREHDAVFRIIPE
jgi:putative protease